LKLSTKWPSTFPKAQAITDAIGRFIACDLRPYSIVETSSFKKMFDVAQSKYAVPSRTHFSQTVIPSFYNDTREAISNQLAQVPYISLTTDSWTSRATENFVTVTAHFISEDWEPTNFVLQTRSMNDRHTAENLTQELEAAIGEWGLDSARELTVTTDNAKNIVKAIKNSPSVAMHIPCFAHTVNLMTQSGIGIECVKELLGAIRKVVTFFHKSTSANALFRANQKQLDIVSHKLIMDVSTR
jgi:uncharacterized protein YbcI